MKTTYKSILAALALAPVFSGCIEDPIATNLITADQLEGNPAAVEALVWALPGHMNSVGTISTSHWDIGYGGIMHIRDLITADLVHSELGANYDHFWTWGEIQAFGPGYLYPQFYWNWFYEHILAANKVIQSIDGNTENTTLRWELGTGYAWRAWSYLDLARMYEALPTDVYTLTDQVLGLTVPIVDETTTEEQMRNNPRVKHDVIVKFIKGDLDKAIALYEGAAGMPADKTIPSLAVVYGLYARLLLWDASYLEEIDDDQTAANKQYEEAKKYAGLAISTSGATPLTRAQWLDTSTGFNDSSVSSWLFAAQYVTEDTGVQAPNVSWTGWLATEKSYGYASTRLKCFSEIGASVYNRISDRDFRKLSFVAPEGTALSGQEPFLDATLAEQYFTRPYINIKFRPGSGSIDNGQTGCAVAYPLMRVEEMHFISIECDAHLDAESGKTALINFMKSYRNTSYNCMVTDKDDIIEEIIFQKRVEFWGEGLSYYDIKRLDYPVVRYYDGTNFYGDMLRNTTRRPAWMNICVTNQEVNNNQGIPSTLNTPSPDGLYPVISNK